MRSRVFIRLLACFIAAAGILPARTEQVQWEISVYPQELASGEKGQMTIICRIAPGFHVSAVAPTLFEIDPDPLPGLVFESPRYPSSITDHWGSVYRDSARITVPFKVAGGAVQGQTKLTVNLKSQPCDEKSGICYAPQTEKVETNFTVLAGGQSQGLEGRLNRALESESILAFFLVFLGGLLTSMTPCVYPMIPITIAVIGAQASGGRMKGFVLSLFYVLGMGVTFSALGVIAAKTGGLFGAYAKHPVAIGIISAIFFIMGLSMLGIFVMQMPASVATRLRGKKRSGYAGVFLTGLLAGLVVSPCISPLLVVILTWVARSASVVMGAGLLFTFAMGLGVLFILIGTFSGILKSLPRSGGWMGMIEHAFGLVLIALAILFIKPILSIFAYRIIWSMFLIILGTFLGAFTPLEKEASGKQKLGKAAGLFIILVGGCLLFFGFSDEMGWKGTAVEPSQEMEISGEGWLTSDTEAFKEASVSGKPVLLDFFAEWCAACKELDEKTWPDRTVKMELDRYIRVRLDLTRLNERTRELQRKYRVIGMPTVILLDSGSKEISRFEGFQPPDFVVKFLQSHIRKLS